MRGLVQALPAAWNHARALMPSQSKERGPSWCRWPQLGAGSGKGQNPALDRWTIAQTVGAGRTSNQNKPAGGGWRMMRPTLAFGPEVFACLRPPSLSRRSGCLQLDGLADPPPPCQAALRRNLSWSKGT